MNTHTSYFTFSVAEVVQAAKRGWGEEGEGRQGPPRGLDLKRQGKNYSPLGEGLVWSGGFPLIGGRCIFQEGSKAG